MDLSTFLQKIEQELSKKQIFYLRIKVNPGATKNEITELLLTDEPVLKIKIAAPPTKGKANHEICKFLGKKFDCKCDIISGSTGPTKLIKLTR